MGWRKKLVTAWTSCARGRAAVTLRPLVLGGLVFSLERSESSPVMGQRAANHQNVSTHSIPNPSLNSASDMMLTRSDQMLLSIV